MDILLKLIVVLCRGQTRQAKGSSHVAKTGRSRLWTLLAASTNYTLSPRQGGLCPNPALPHIQPLCLLVHHHARVLSTAGHQKQRPTKGFLSNLPLNQSPLLGSKPERTAAGAQGGRWQEQVCVSYLGGA